MCGRSFERIVVENFASKLNFAGTRCGDWGDQKKAPRVFL